MFREEKKTLQIRHSIRRKMTALFSVVLLAAVIALILWAFYLPAGLPTTFFWSSIMSAIRRRY